MVSCKKQSILVLSYETEKLLSDISSEFEIIEFENLSTLCSFYSKFMDSMLFKHFDSSMRKHNRQMFENSNKVYFLPT